MIRRLEIGLTGIQRMKLEIHMLRKCVREETVVNIALGGGLVKQLRGSEVVYRSVEKGHIISYKAVRSKVRELGAGHI